MQLYLYVYISVHVAFIVRSMKVFNNAYNIAYAYESYHRREIHHIAEKRTYHTFKVAAEFRPLFLH